MQVSFSVNVGGKFRDSGWCPDLIEGGCLTRGLPNTRLFTVYVYFKMTDYIDGH